MHNITHNTFWHWPSVLTKEECESIIKSADDSKWLENNKWKQAGVTEKAIINLELRETKIKWLDTMSPLGCLMQAYLNAANHYAGWNYDIRYMEKVQIGKYSEEENSFYDWHIDTSVPNSNEEQRKLSISLLLSDPKEYEGGRLEFKELTKEQNEKLLPTRGSIVVFPSFIDHRVTPVTKGIRYSAVTWMIGNKFK